MLITYLLSKRMNICIVVLLSLYCNISLIYMPTLQDTVTFMRERNLTFYLSFRSLEPSIKKH